MKSTIFFKNALVLILTLCALPVLAQFPPPPAPSVPIDGGLLSVIGAGIAYGGYQHYKRKKK